MNTSVVLLLLAFWLNAVNAQTVPDVQVVGGERSGYIQVTVRGSTGPVCGSVDRATASYACSQKGFTDVSSWGTVNSLGDISQPTSSPVGSNLDCIRYRSGTRYVNNRRQPTYRTRCSVSSSAGCARGDTAAVVCGGLTNDQRVGIIVGSIVGFTVLIIISICILACILIYIRQKRLAARRTRENVETSEDRATVDRSTCQ